MAGLKDHLLSIPPVTRFFLVTSLAVSLGISAGLLLFENVLANPNSLFLGIEQLLGAEFSLRSYFKLAKHGLLEAPKLFTGFFVVEGLGTNGVMVLYNIFRFYTFSNYLENTRGHFLGNFPDYLWFVLVTGFFLVWINNFFALAECRTLFYHSQMSSCMTYLWLRTSMNTLITFLGIVPIKAYYLPLFDLGIAIMSGDYHFADSLSGILAAYLYQCIQSDTLPLYNLLPRAYGGKSREQSGHRVGFNVNTSTSTNLLTPSIFDLGYWKAPRFFYKLLKYPMSNLKSTTAFTKRSPLSASVTAKARSSDYSSGHLSSFQGKGHRLGS